MNTTTNTHNVRTRNNRPNRPSRKADSALLLIVIALVLFGIMMVYSSSYYVSAIKLDDSTYYLRRQTMYALIGFVVMYLAANFDYRLYNSQIPWSLYFVSLALVIYAGFFGVSSNGASRWISLFGVISIQPSEIAKVSIILLMPYQIARRPSLLNSIKGHIELMMPTLIMTVFVAKENLSTAIIIFVIGVGILFLASPRIKEFIIIGVVGVVGMTSYLVISALFGDGFRGERLLAWLDPFAYAQGKGFQIIQSLYAVASGGFYGLIFRLLLCLSAILLISDGTENELKLWGEETRFTVLPLLFKGKINFTIQNKDNLVSYKRNVTKNSII